MAATAGPGLIGGLLVGLTTAKAIALAHRLPLIAVNHLEAHALTVGLTEGLAPPYLLLLVSGGHTQLLLVEDVGRYVRLGTTIDDALGEAFDKTAKLLGPRHSRRSRRRASGAQRGWPALRLAAADAGPARAAFLVRRPEDRGAPAGDEAGAADGAGRRRYLRVVRGGGGRQRRGSGAARDGVGRSDGSEPQRRGVSSSPVASRRTSACGRR